MSDDLDALVSQVEALHLLDDDVLVLTCPVPVSDEVAARLRFYLLEALGQRPVLVLDSGMQLSALGQHRQLQRIETTLATVQAQLSTLLRALADEDELAPGRTLDGDLFSSRERDPSEPL